MRQKKGTLLGRTQRRALRLRGGRREGADALGRRAVETRGSGVRGGVMALR